MNEHPSWDFSSNPSVCTNFQSSLLFVHFLHCSRSWFMESAHDFRWLSPTYRASTENRWRCLTLLCWNVSGNCKMAFNAKSIWRKISRENKDVSFANTELIADADPELCVKLLKTPSLKNFSGIRPRLEKASKEWLSEFLVLGGMNCLLDSLSCLSGTRRFSEALEQIECVRCIKAVMNSPTGLELMIQSNELTRSLIKGKRKFYV